MGTDIEKHSFKIRIGGGGKTTNWYYYLCNTDSMLV